jgi:hypothetical protein
MDPLVVVLMIVGRAGYLGGAGGMAMAQRGAPAAQHRGAAMIATLLVLTVLLAVEIWWLAEA